MSCSVFDPFPVLLLELSIKEFCQKGFLRHLFSNSAGLACLNRGSALVFVDALQAFACCVLGSAAAPVLSKAKRSWRPRCGQPVFQHLEMSQTGMVLVSFRVLFWNPDKYGNTTVEDIYIVHIFSNFVRTYRFFLWTLSSLLKILLTFWHLKT